MVTGGSKAGLDRGVLGTASAARSRSHTVREAKYYGLQFNAEGQENLTVRHYHACLHMQTKGLLYVIQ